MTVTSRKQQSCEYPNSNNASDAESMHLASASTSDAESDISEPIANTRIGQNLRVKVPLYEDFARLKKTSGKRKQRRFKNRSELQILAEEDEEETEYIKLMENYKSPLSRLMDSESALQYWHAFNDLPEEEQYKLFETLPKTHVQHVETKPENPLTRISSKIKRAMKIKKNVPTELFQKIEVELLDYFKMCPGGAYLSTPPTSFERLLLHAIARYHNLKSISIFGMLLRVVEVSSPPDWMPMEMRFCDFVKTLRQ